jgi:hypothetical protein
MSVHSILAKHFVPAGVLGGWDSKHLQADLRQYARTRAISYMLLLLLLLAILASVGWVTYREISAGGGPRLALLAAAGLSVPGVLELVRKTVSEWSKATLLEALCRRLDGSDLRGIVQAMLDARDDESKQA